jgi:hypothetical protein
MCRKQAETYIAHSTKLKVLLCDSRKTKNPRTPIHQEIQEVKTHTHTRIAIIMLSVEVGNSGIEKSRAENGVVLRLTPPTNFYNAQYHR